MNPRIEKTRDWRNNPRPGKPWNREPRAWYEKAQANALPVKVEQREYGWYS